MAKSIDSCRIEVAMSPMTKCWLAGGVVLASLLLFSGGRALPQGKKAPAPMVPGRYQDIDRFKDTNDALLDTATGDFYCRVGDKWRLSQAGPAELPPDARATPAAGRFHYRPRAETLLDTATGRVYILESVRRSKGAEAERKWAEEVAPIR